jgi:acyl transferase domain-containing protein
VTELGLAVLCPGQGAYFPGALRDARGTHPVIGETLDAIDAVASEQFGGSVSEFVCEDLDGDAAGRLEREPWITQLAIYGIDVAVYRALEAQGLRPGAVAGHSFGEIAALTCAGAFTVEDGAALVCHRIRALEAVDVAGGWMAAVAADSGRAGTLVDLLADDRLAVAAENHSGQTVLSGPGPTMEMARAVARALRVSFVPLQSPWPFHCPLMSPAVARFAAEAGRVRQRPLEVPVFSPILERWYTDGDALAACLAEHLVRPVRFGDAIRRLRDDGVSTFVECGASDALSRLVGRILGPDAATVACLQAGQPRALEAAIGRLRADGHLARGASADLAAALLPGVPPDRFRVFWRACGEQVVARVRDAFDRYEREHEEAAAGWGDRAAASPDGDRQRLFQELTALYAAALEYPAEVFTEDVLLESELGVDSVKQAELLARVRERYRLPARPADFRLGDYGTMGRLTDLVRSLTAGAPTPR